VVRGEAGIGETARLDRAAVMAVGMRVLRAPIMDRYGLRTKTEAVDLALRHLAGQPMTREEALAMEGARAILDTPADVPPRTA